MASPPASAVTALVPLRAGGKTRLGPRLDATDRRRLATAMLTDVCAALGAAGIGRTVVVANGHDAILAARHLDVEVVVDHPTSAGLNGALRLAAAQVTPTGPLLVVAADLPRIAAADIHRMLTPDAPVVLAPTTDGGTGALLRRPFDVIAPAFGPASAAAHRRLAAEAGVSCAIVDAPGLGADLDTVGELRALRPHEAGAATAAVLRDLDEPLAALR